MNFNYKLSDWNGYIDVGNKWMLAICVGDDFLILMPEIRYKWNLFVVEKRSLDRRWKIKDVSDETTQNPHEQFQNHQQSQTHFVSNKLLKWWGQPWRWFLTGLRELRINQIIELFINWLCFALSAYLFHMFVQ